MLIKKFKRIQDFFSCFAIFVMGISLFAVLLNYVYWHFQSVRGPSLVYFYASLLIALLSRRFAIVMIIFFMPLLPTLHIQMEPIFQPAVKYFIAYPGLDAIAGFCLGIFLNHIYRYRSFRITLDQIPWPFGFFLLVLTISTTLAISRNLWVSGIHFSITDLFNNILNFKLMDRVNSFMPLANLIVYALAVMFAVVLLNILKYEKNKNDLVFKPLIFSVIVAACWGIYQSQTAFGLSDLTRNYRLENFGFGAEGFQPDIHAFAGHMLIGAVGLFFYAASVQSKHTQYLIVVAVALSWIALILSKSRASFVFAVIAAILFLIFFVKSKNISSLKKIFLPAALIITVTISAFIVSYFWWIADLLSSFKTPTVWDFEALNLLSRWRLEFHRAALLMFEAYPLMGVGEGNFFRLSSVIDFSQSSWMVTNGRNHAHNYFLQVLAETGLIGLISYALIFIWPVLHVKDKKELAPVGLAILSVFLGNIYSHSLIIRENLFLLAILVALMYAQISNTTSEKLHLSYVGFVNNKKLLFITTLLLFILLTAIYLEIKNSFYEFPFLYGSTCTQGVIDMSRCIK